MRFWPQRRRAAERTARHRPSRRPRTHELGLALVPSLLLVSRFGPGLLDSPHWWRWPLLGALGGTALLLWGFALLGVVPLFNLVLPTRLRAFRGGYFTVSAVPWHLHNALFYLVRFTFPLCTT